VREDVTDIVLNLKGVAIRMEVDGPKRLTVQAKGPGVVTAGDISESAGIEILNRDHVICHLDEGAQLYMELTVAQGKGYVSADKNKPEDAPIGLIPIDAIYSPVKRVSYDVQPTREGQVLDYDKLTMKVRPTAR
jgi:DNA-directed RNA polymerase subunit alpha